MGLVSLFRKIIGLGLLAGAAFTANVALATDDAAAIRGILGGDIVRVGAVSAPPWYDRDLRSNAWVGLVPDIVEAIFTPYGIGIEYVDTQWGTAAAGLQADRFDLLGGFNETPERARAVDFTRPIGAHKMGVLTLEEDLSRYQTWEQVNDPSIRLAAIDGSAVATLLQPVLTRAQWVIVPNSEAMQLEVESGRVNALLSNDVQMGLYVSTRGRGHYVFPTPIQAQDTNIGLRKDRETFRDWLNARLDALEQDGTLERLWGSHIPAGR